MPIYYKRGDAIKGKKIFCVFKAHSLFSSNKKHRAFLWGDPAQTVVEKIWNKKKN